MIVLELMKRRFLLPLCAVFMVLLACVLPPLLAPFFAVHPHHYG
jgi:hypothetical protein